MRQERERFTGRAFPSSPITSMPLSPKKEPLPHVLRKKRSIWSVSRQRLALESGRKSEPRSARSTTPGEMRRAEGRRENSQGARERREALQEAREEVAPRGARPKGEAEKEEKSRWGARSGVHDEDELGGNSSREDEDEFGGNSSREDEDEDKTGRKSSREDEDELGGNSNGAEENEDEMGGDSSSEEKVENERGRKSSQEIIEDEDKDEEEQRAYLCCLQFEKEGDE